MLLVSMICQLSYAQRHNDRSRVEWGPRDNSFVQMRNDDETLKSPPFDICTNNEITSRDFRVCLTQKVLNAMLEE